MPGFPPSNTSPSAAPNSQQQQSFTQQSGGMPSHSSGGGVGGNAEDCGEMCFGEASTLPGSKEAFYCNKGEKCCPLGPFGHECSTECGPYDPNGTL